MDDAKRLFLVVMNRGPAAPDGAFVVQLVVHPDATPSRVGFYPTPDEVTGKALAEAFREFAGWAENNEPAVRSWYRRAGAYCHDGLDTPEQVPTGGAEYVRSDGVDATTSPLDPCGTCQHNRADHGALGCAACKAFGAHNAVCMRFRRDQ